MILKDQKHNSFIEMKVDHGYFHMAAQVRLSSLIEMYVYGLVIFIIVRFIKNKLKQLFKRKT